MLPGRLRESSAVAEGDLSVDTRSRQLTTRCSSDLGQKHLKSLSKPMRTLIRLTASALIALLSSRVYMIVEEDGGTTLRRLSRDTNTLKGGSLAGHRFQTASRRSTCDLTQKPGWLLLKSENALRYAGEVA
jgi:hypothetical protein